MASSADVNNSGYLFFNSYVKTNKLGDFKAGYYELKPSMTLEQISKALQKGGASEPLDSGKVLIKEGVTIDEIQRSYCNMVTTFHWS